MKKNGFTIIELLIALAITAMILTTMALAFNASAVNYSANENIFKAVSGARQALFRMTTQIRSGLVDPNDASSQDRCRLLCADGSEFTYRYDSGDSTLYLFDHGTGTDYVLCQNVAAMTFKKTIDASTGDVKSVQISITVNSGDFQQTLTAAAAVRKVL